MKICDLHTHSIYSDGTWTPEQILDEAERIGLGAVALCDHNTIDGLPRFMASAQGREVEAVPGIEFSTVWNGIELHILGLWIQPEHYATITELLEDAHRRKDASNRALVEALQNAGYVLDYDKLRASTPGGHINRAHIGAELTRLGYTVSIREAFQTLLSEKCGYYQPPDRITATQCIRFIRSLGAVAVLAHPLLTLNEEKLRCFLQEAMPAGLDGMESRYVTYDDATTKTAMQIAQQFGLKNSGGSDFHGENKPGILLGVGKGDLKVPLELVKTLKVR